MPPILQYIQQLLAATPFVAFTIHLTGGDNVKIKTHTDVTFPISGQGVFVLLSKGSYRGYTETGVDHVELKT